MAKTRKNRKNKNRAQGANDNAAGLDMSMAQRTENEPSDGYMYLNALQHMAGHDRQMADAFDALRTKSDLGLRLVNAAQKLDVRFVREEFNKASTQGRTRGNIISLSANNSLPEDITVLAHELMHWTQPAADLYDRWDFRSRLLAVLSKEAGAETCAVKVTHEMRENGYADAFNLNAAPVDRSMAMYGAMYRKFDEVLQASRKDGCENPLLDATDAAFHTYFNQPELVRSYGVKVLLNYIDSVVRCAKYYPTPGFSLQAAANQARVQGGECLVYEPAELPLRDEDLFRGNDYLRQAFEYTEMIHISKHCNHETALAFQRKFRDLADDNNPFLALRFNEIRRAYQAQKWQKNSKNILRVMMELADIQERHTPQTSFDFG